MERWILAVGLSDFEHQQIHNEVQVIAEFGDVSDGTSYVEHGMAREIMRLREALKHETQWADAGIDSTAFWQQQRDDLREMVNAAQWAETVASAELEQLRRVLAALRKPSEAIMVSIGEADGLHGDVSEERMVAMLRAAVAAAEQEVQGER